jgi:creatinine amidohydrolase
VESLQEQSLTEPARRNRAARLALAAVAGLAVAFYWVQRPLTAPLPDTVQIADMTWVEVRSALARGYTTVIVPSGGIEQNGPHMVLGKHDYIVGWSAAKIAKELGQTLVAPVIPYVPEAITTPRPDTCASPARSASPKRSTPGCSKASPAA